MNVNSVNPCATAAVTNGGTLFGMQGMFGVYQESPNRMLMLPRSRESDRTPEPSPEHRTSLPGVDKSVVSAIVTQAMAMKAERLSFSRHSYLS